MRAWIRAAVLTTLCAVTQISVPEASAQNYPDRPIRIIAPFPAGGLADVLARAVGEEVSKALSQPVIVENRAGAGGNVGADAVAKADPDGYTLLMTSAGIQSANQFLYAKMPFDPEKAFAPISLVADMPILLLVNPTKVKAANLKEFLDFARANPGKLNFGSPGIGTTGHLALAYFMHAANVKITHVPYRGAAPSVQGLVAGETDGTFDNPPTVIGHVRSGTLKALGVTDKQRLPLVPDVPTISEGGVPNFVASSWFGLVAPAGTPPAIIKRLQAEVAKAVKSPTVQQFTQKAGARAVGNAPEEFGQFIVAERKKWGEIIKSAGITAQ
jgi:tripartite-type tricarboxylate transporter receptor subunit TctC